jgi:hypothetical protein
MVAGDIGCEEPAEAPVLRGDLTEEDLGVDAAEVPGMEIGVGFWVLESAEIPITR